MKQKINSLLIRLGLRKATTNGAELVEETLAGFVSIVENLHEGAVLIASEMEDNAAAIKALQEQNLNLTQVSKRAFNVRQNLLKIMGE